MNLQQLINLARTRLRDLDLDNPLCTNEDLTDFANAAVDEACIRARLLQSHEILVITPGVAEYAIDALVLRPQGLIYLDPTGASTIAGSFIIGRWHLITTVGTTDFTLIGSANNLVGTYFRATGLGTGTGVATVCQQYPLYPVSQSQYYQALGNSILNPGIPSHYAIGIDANSIALYTLPKAAGAIALDLRRLPNDSDKMVNPADEPIIPARYHRDLVHWMLVEAYNIHSSDLLDPKAAERYEAKFERLFGRKPSALAETQGQRNVVGGDIAPATFGGSFSQSSNYG